MALQYVVDFISWKYARHIPAIKPEAERQYPSEKRGQSVRIHIFAGRARP